MTAPAPGGRLPRRNGAEPDAREARRRHPSTVAAGIIGRRADPLGKMALFSSGENGRPFGTLFIECSDCGRETPVSALDAARAAFPMSVHLPFVRRYHSLMRCPACGRRAWVRLRWTLS
ncbi:MAG: hypothetical protein WD770_00605 [Actinomycetota bacterium]